MQSTAGFTRVLSTSTHAERYITASQPFDNNSTKRENAKQAFIHVADNLASALSCVIHLVVREACVGLTYNPANGCLATACASLVAVKQQQLHRLCCYRTCCIEVASMHASVPLQRAANDRENSTLRQTVDQLTEHIKTLQKQLGALHSTDLVALRRAHKSLTQHVTALKSESKGIDSALLEVETDVFATHFIAEQMTAAGIVAGVAWTFLTWVSAQKFKDKRVKSFIYGATAVVSALAVGGHTLVQCFRRVARVTEGNRSAIDRLSQDWKLVKDRIQIMDDLSQGDAGKPAEIPYVAVDIPVVPPYQSDSNQPFQTEAAGAALDMAYPSPSPNELAFEMFQDTPPIPSAPPLEVGHYPTMPQEYAGTLGVRRGFNQEGGHWW